MKGRKPGHPETERLRALLRARVEASGRSYRDLERQAGLGHGTLSNILGGRTTLCVHHISLLAGMLGFTEAEFFLEAGGGLESFRKLLLDTVRAELQAVAILPRPVGFDTAPCDIFLEALAARYGPLELVLLASDDPYGKPPWRIVITARAFDELSRQEAIEKASEVLASCAAERLISSLDVMPTGAPLVSEVRHLVPAGAQELQFLRLGEIPRALLLRVGTSQVESR
jgi:transcriptional regulator with XRE-family HTH domain